MSSRKSTFLRKQNQTLLPFETLEPRVVLSADLFAAGPSISHHGASSVEVHALTVLPNIAADPANSQDTLSTVTPVTLSETFYLNSNPGADHTIYLDFDGHVTSGTIWNSNYNAGQDIITPAYDFDGNTASFSDSELQRIQWIWERVSEDFLPFDVNVTTEDPGIAALSKSGSGDDQWGARIVVGGSSSNWWGSPAGGVAYVSSFNWSTDSPGFVFEAQLGNGNEKYTAEAISHEAGHTLGLSHDGRISPSEEYFQGHGSGVTAWAPIMGNGYYNNVTQWSKGEYANASQTQNDLAILSSNNGFTYRADDHGSSDNSATLLDVSNDTISDWGIIERTSDVDVFAFNTNTGSIQINANPLNRGPNLDVILELYDAASNLVAVSNPVNALGAAINLSVSAGQYFLHVSGSGNGDPGSNGYSEYASLGQYFLSGMVVPVQNDFLSISGFDASKAEGDSGSTNFTFVVSRTGDTSTATSVDYTVGGSGSSAADASDFASESFPSGSLSFAVGETSKTITVQVSADSEVENDEGFIVALSNASGDTVITSASSAGLIINDDAAANVGITVTPTSGLRTKERGTSASFTVVLQSRPTADVTIQVTSLDTTEGRVSTDLLRFTIDNWDTAQVVTVTGVDDTVRDGNVSFTVELAASQSNDVNYDGLAVDDVQLTNQDDDKRGNGNGRGGNGQGADVPNLESTPWVAIPQGIQANQFHEAEDDKYRKTRHIDEVDDVFASEMNWTASQESNENVVDAFDYYQPSSDRGIDLTFQELDADFPWLVDGEIVSAV